MEKERYSQRVTICRFADLGSVQTYVYLLESANHIFIIDTFCGALSMEPLVADLQKKEGKRVLVVNTHFHWDHVWGNCAFAAEVIGHEQCRVLLAENWEAQLDKQRKFLRGQVERRLPTITFAQRLSFPEDGIELFYSPGHTRDCISLFDQEERILYVGDNLELPLVYVEDPDLKTYLKTLETYETYRPKLIMAGHSTKLTLDDLRDTISYLKKLQSGTEIELATEHERQLHQSNLQVVHGS